MNNSEFDIRHSKFEIYRRATLSIIRNVLVLLFVLATAASAQPPLRIGTVTIRALDVYSSEEAGKGWLYRVADRLHIETRKSVVEKFLLFREGEEYRPELLAQTERNLRALRFLKSASVVASPPRNGVVDVVVTTQDAWSIAPETQAGSKGGESTYGATLSDSNLIGLGKELTLEWDKGIDRNRLGINYNDPTFFAPYWNAKFGYAHNSDGYDHRFSVVRPWYSFTAPWAAEMSFTGFTQESHLYRDGVEHQRFRHHRREIVGSYGIAVAADDTAATRLTAGTRFIDNSFSTIHSEPLSVLPEPRSFRYVFLRLDRVENDFVKLNFVNKDIRFEDFNLGRQTSLEAAISPRAFGPDSNTASMRVAVSDGHRVGANAFVMPSMSVSSRFAGGPAHTIATSSLVMVRRAEARYPRALVGRIAVTSGWRVDHDVQFFADGLTGLRGYRAHSFSGTRAIVINLEERLYLGREILQLASPGLVAFIDAGNATDGGLSDLMELKADVGVGIRIGLPRTPRNLLRFDVSYALQRDPVGRRGLMFSFSSGQAF
jgi:Omp85 superfamily domain